MKQINLFRRSLFPLIAFIMVTLATSASAASKEDDLRDALITNGQACAQKGDQNCADVCESASKNIADKTLSSQCFWLYKKAAMGGKLMRGDPAFEQMRQQGRFCVGRRDAPCAQACKAAAQDPANAELVAQCNTEYQRILAANPPPKPKPEESMTLEARIALMKDKGAYCTAKYSHSLPAGTRRAVDNCKRGCLDKRAYDPNYPENRRIAAVSQCENAYYNVVKALGK
ncbi:hypothetical protein [Sneathiella sp.]|uniref:hypothetical protein n=1 Tax=Sneathiella sp. TaxID=1964365 RepID=UPI00261A73EC|nr:hypothetical protein [Sneathiella sp.]MDF2367216.1 hypothetical protein [Sneathiella sp.]